MNWVTVSLPYAYGYIELNSYGFVVDAPPIFRWMIHKHESQIVEWVKRKGGELLKEDEESDETNR